MGIFLDITSAYRKDHPEPESPNSSGIPDVDTAHRLVQETRKLRDQWAAACLSLAQSQNWESIYYKQGHKVLGGEYGWRLFCAEANLTVLRDQAYPALVARMNRQRP